MVQPKSILEKARLRRNHWLRQFSAMQTLEHILEQGTPVERLCLAFEGEADLLDARALLLQLPTNESWRKKIRERRNDYYRRAQKFTGAVRRIERALSFAEVANSNAAVANTNAAATQQISTHMREALRAFEARSGVGMAPGNPLVINLMAFLQKARRDQGKAEELTSEAIFLADEAELREHGAESTVLVQLSVENSMLSFLQKARQDQGKAEELTSEAIFLADSEVKLVKETTLLQADSDGVQETLDAVDRFIHLVDSFEESAADAELSASSPGEVQQDLH